MPGLTIYSTINKSNFKHPVLKFFPNYKHSIIKEGTVHISVTAYDEYPIRTFITSEYTCIIEGHIYEETENVNSKLELVCDELFRKKSSSHLKDFINNTDGEYIITCYNNSSKQIFVFNDYLGRLPFYYLENETTVAASREISFITENLKPKLNKYACAEFLLFGYPLGNNTLHECCFRLTPSSLLKINYDNKTITHTSIVDLNFEDTNSRIIETEEIVKSLVDEFNSSILRRVKKHTNITLSLSGGLDSRVIMGSFDSLNVDYQIRTYSDFNNTAKSDIEIVKKLTKSKQDKFKIVNLDKSSQHHEEVLLGIKKGLNYSGMSFILEYFEKIQQKKLSFWTGDGGDKVLTNLHPLRTILSKNDLLNYILQENQIFDLNEVSKLLNIPKHTLKTHLINHLDKYPERQLKNKYLRFMMMERGFKWLFEGEDRNRYYFPSISPFYSIAFYKLAMEVPHKLKYNFKLYKGFLNQISKPIANIPNANWSFSINKNYKIKLLYLKQSIKSWLKLLIRFNNTANSIKRAYYHTYTKVK